MRAFTARPSINRGRGHNASPSVLGSSTDARLSRPIIALLIAAILLGCALRFYRPDHRVFWDDEVYTTIKILGYTEADVRDRLVRVHDERAVRRLLHPEAAHFQAAPLDTVRSLAKDEPQHAPLYYLVAQTWVTLFGASVLSLRILSATFGVMAIPLAYMLTRELFAARTSALIGAAFFALSPVLIIYAQEIREYGLWSAAILGSSYAFLRAWRLMTYASWLVYTVAIALALYIDPLSLLFIVAHGVSVVGGAEANDRRGAAFGSFAVSVSIALVAFLPWFLVIASSGAQVHRSMATILDTRLPFGGVVRALLRAIRIDSLDFNTGNRALLNLALAVIVTAVVGVSFAALARNGSARQRWFVFSLVMVTSVPIILLDIIFSGKRVESIGYFIPTYVGIDLALIYLSSNLLRSFSATRRQRAISSALVATLLIARLGAGISSARAQTWWNDYHIRSIDVAHIIDAARDPFVASDAYLGYSLSVLEYVAPSTGVYLRPRCYLCTTPDSREDSRQLIAHAGDNVFLIGPTPKLQATARDALRPRHREYRCVDIRGICKGDLDLY